MSPVARFTHAIYLKPRLRFQPRPSRKFDQRLPRLGPLLGFVVWHRHALARRENSKIVPFSELNAHSVEFGCAEIEVANETKLGQIFVTGAGYIFHLVFLTRLHSTVRRPQRFKPPAAAFVFAIRPPA